MDSYVLSYLLSGTRGGLMRTRILYRLSRGSCNAHQLKDALGVDYKTVTHHLRVLVSNRLVSSSQVHDNNYGKAFFVTDFFRSQKSVFDEIWEKVNKGV